MRSHRSILRLAPLMRPCATLSRFPSDDAARRDEKPRPEHCRTGNLAANRIDIWLNRAKIAAALEAGGRSQRPYLDPVVLSIEAKLRRAGKGKRLVIANGAEAEVNAGLVELIKDAFTIRIRNSTDGWAARSMRVWRSRRLSRRSANAIRRRAAFTTRIAVRNMRRPITESCSPHMASLAP
jgi:hypothetical protein